MSVLILVIFGPNYKFLGFISITLYLCQPCWSCIVKKMPIKWLPQYWKTTFAFLVILKSTSVCECVRVWQGRRGVRAKVYLCIDIFLPKMFSFLEIGFQNGSFEKKGDFWLPTYINSHILHTLLAFFFLAFPIWKKKLNI